MNKTFTINLSDSVFHIEEDAYNQFESYLSSIRAQFSSYEDADDIIKDIEQRMAEILRDELLQGRNVITIEDIQQLRKIMGSEKDFAQSEEGSEQERQKEERQLFRDSENKIIAGVCSGLAAYFGIDVTLVRILFTVCAITGVLSGFAIILYILLWVITPEAKSLSQRMQMRGEPVTLKNIEDTLRNTVERGKKKFSEKKEQHGEDISKASNRLLSAAERFFQLLGDLFWKLISLIRKLAGLLFILIGFALLMASVAALAGILFIGSVLVFHPSLVIPAIPFSYDAQALFFLISAGLTLLIPITALALTGLSLMRQSSLFSVNIAAVMLLLWIFSIGSGSILAANVVPRATEAAQQFKNQPEQFDSRYEKSTRVLDLSEFNTLSASGIAQITLVKGETPKAELSGPAVALDQILIENKQQLLDIRADRLKPTCFFCPTPYPEIIISTPALPESIKAGDLIQLSLKDVVTDKLRLTAEDLAKVDISGEVRTLNAEMNDGARLTLIGTGQSLSIAAKNLSQVDASHFQVDSVKTDTEGRAMILINPSKTLEVTAQDFSEIRYWGNPEVKSFLSDRAKLISPFDHPDEPEIPSIEPPETPIE